MTYGRAAGTAGVLPFTGLAFGWKVMLALTILAAGMAVLRLVPRPSS